MSVFKWAEFRSTKSVIKVHTQIDIATEIPVFYRITNAKVHDVNSTDWFTYETLAGKREKGEKIEKRKRKKRKKRKKEEKKKGKRKKENRVDVGDYSPNTSHCTVRTGLVYGATYI